MALHRSRARNMGQVNALHRSRVGNMDRSMGCTDHVLETCVRDLGPTDHELETWTGPCCPTDPKGLSTILVHTDLSGPDLSDVCKVVTLLRFSSEM